MIKEINRQLKSHNDTIRNVKLANIMQRMNMLNELRIYGLVERPSSSFYGGC